MIHVLPQRFGHGAVPLVRVHHRREDILLPADDLHRRPVRFLIELSGVFVPAVVVEVGGVHVEDQFPEEVGVLLESPGGDRFLRLHPVEDLRVPCSRGFEMYVHGRPLRHYVLVDVGFLLPLVVPLDVRDFLSGEVGVSHRGPVFSVVSQVSPPSCCESGNIVGDALLRKCNNPL